MMVLNKQIYLRIWLFLQVLLQNIGMIQYKDMKLLKQYLLCCIYFNNYSDSPDEYAEKLEELEKLRKKFYPKESPNYQVEKVICQKIHNNIFLMYSINKEKFSKDWTYSKVHFLRLKVFVTKNLYYIFVLARNANLLSRTGILRLHCNYSMNPKNNSFKTQNKLY